MPTPPTKKDVYVAGFVYDSGGSGSPAVWKNGVLQRLPPYSNVSSSAGAITVSDSNVYIAGSMSSFAVYWQDSALNVIPTPFQLNSSANAIAVSASDVYVAGWERDFSANSGGSVVYWKNGVKTTLATAPI